MKFCSAVLEEQRIRDGDGRANERTNERTDRHKDHYIPPANFAGGIINSEERCYGFERITVCSPSLAKVTQYLDLNIYLGDVKLKKKSLVKHSDYTEPKYKNSMQFFNLTNLLGMIIGFNGNHNLLRNHPELQHQTLHWVP